MVSFVFFRNFERQVLTLHSTVVTLGITDGDRVGRPERSDSRPLIMSFLIG